MTDAVQPGSSLKRDEMTLHLIATGVIRLGERISRGDSMGYPYPTELQRGANRLVAARLMRKQTPPQGIPDLLNWCRAPIADWALDLPADAVGQGDRLLDGYTPTDVCDCWACSGTNIEEDLTERHFMSQVFALCRLNGGANVYTQFRLFIVQPEHRVLTALDFQKASLDFSLYGLKDLLLEAYTAAPVSCLFGSEYVCCARCGNLLQRDERGEPTCENERCRLRRITVGRRIKATEEPVWLIRALRRYIADPGLAELNLKKGLEILGLAVELWPDFDRYDLRATTPDGRCVWVLDVKDWANPFLLASQVKAIQSDTAGARAYYVFPDERGQAWPDYVQAFDRYSPPGCQGILMRSLIKQVKQEIGR